jgi:hypothetical protein
MPLLVACPKCKRKLKIGDDAVGKRFKCSDCGAVFAARGSTPAASGSRPPAVEQPDRRPPTRPATAKEPRSEADEEPRRPASDGGASSRDRERASGTPRRRAVPKENIAVKADQGYDEEPEERAPRRRRTGKDKQRKASLALRISALILGLIGGLFSGGLGVAWLTQASSPEVKAMRDFAASVANETGSKELKENLARLDRMVRSSYFLLLAAPLGIAGGVLALLGRVKLGGALMLAAVPVPLILNVLSLMALYFLLVGGLLALLTPSWPPGGGPPTAVLALLTAGGWVAVLVGWVVLILALPKPTPEVKTGPGPAAVPPGQRGGMGVGPGGPPAAPAPGPAPTPSPQPPSSAAEPATPITAEELTKEYLADREAADRKFKSKLLVVDGIVHFNFISKPEWFSVELKGVKKGNGEVMVVVCFLRRDLQGKLSPDAVHEGEPARLKGRCTGLDWQNRPSLADCELAPGTNPAGGVQGPRQNGTQPMTQNQPTPSRLPAKPDFSLTAEAFYNEVVDNVSAASKKYDGRVVELTGKVTSLGRNELNPNEPPIILLDGGPQQFVLCSTVDKQPWLKCVPGQTVKIRGKVHGSRLYVAVSVHDCEFTVVSGNPATPLSVGQLLKDIASDAAAKQKYDGKIVFLSGEFVSVKKSDTGFGFHRIVELKGDGKRPIHCQGKSSDDLFLKKLKAGEPVTFLGKLELSANKVELKDALLTRAPVLPR